MGDEGAREERVVEEGRSWRGLHSVHVMRLGAEVDLERWIEEKVVPAGGEVEAFYQYEEEELGVWHMRLYWKVPGEALPEVTVTPQEVTVSGKVYVEKEF
jgi:hypothetical protein